MASAREILSDILSSEKTSSVDLPVSFDDISVWGASSSDGYLDALEKESEAKGVNEHKRIGFNAS